jgi:hypothetical protein
VRHVRRWGAVYILLLLFLGSWFGQLLASAGDIEQYSWTYFWSTTRENWQSEWWLQLLVQGVLLLAMKHSVFRADAEALERIESKLDELLDR